MQRLFRKEHVKNAAFQNDKPEHNLNPGLRAVDGFQPPCFMRHSPYPALRLAVLYCENLARYGSRYCTWSGSDGVTALL